MAVYCYTADNDCANAYALDAPSPSHLGTDGIQPYATHQILQSMQSQWDMWIPTNNNA